MFIACQKGDVLRAAINRRLQRAEKALVRGFNFVLDVHFYWWTLRHPFRDAIRLARDTVY
jgi:hypothetical protein